jgi:4beta-methylsterol monooxygenase
MSKVNGPGGQNGRVSLRMAKTSPSAGGPPSFEEARHRRQKVRAAGMNPDYWYPVEWDKDLARGQVIGVKFWGRSIAVYRGEDGVVRAVEDRCAHRQLKLSVGKVTGCNLTCTYHGWQYDGSGKVVSIPHDLFGNKQPEVRVGSYPVEVRHGLIWVFPGDRALAQTRTVPAIPELEGNDPWGLIPVDFTWKAHHSMIMDNVSDFSHAYLHRKSKPFEGAKLTRLETVGDKVLLAYATKVGVGRISGLFVNRKTTNTNAMELGYEYPYQWSNTDDRIKHWCFVLPIDETTTRTFFLFYFSPEMLKVPFIPLSFPKAFIHKVVMPIAKRVLVKPLLEEDGVAVEAEQEGYNAHYDQPIVELNPAINQFQQLTIRKWEEHLEKQGQPAHAARTQTPAVAEEPAASS